MFRRVSFLFASTLFISVLAQAEITGLFTFPDGSDGAVQISSGGVFGSSNTFNFLWSSGTLQVPQIQFGDGTVQDTAASGSGGGGGSMSPGATYYVNVDPPSAQSGSFNINNGTVTTSLAAERFQSANNGDLQFYSYNSAGGSPGYKNVLSYTANDLTNDNFDFLRIANPRIRFAVDDISTNYISPKSISNSGVNQGLTLGLGNASVDQGLTLGTGLSSPTHMYIYFNTSGNDGKIQWNQAQSSFTVDNIWQFTSSMTLSGGYLVQNTAPSSGQVLKFDGTNWAPGTDNTGGGGGGSGTTIWVKKDGANVDTAVSSINFISGGGLNVTSSPSGQVNISLSANSTYYDSAFNAPNYASTGSVLNQLGNYYSSGTTISLFNLKTVDATTYATQANVSASTTNITNTFNNYYSSGVMQNLFNLKTVDATTYQTISNVLTSTTQLNSQFANYLTTGVAAGTYLPITVAATTYAPITQAYNGNTPLAIATGSAMGFNGTISTQTRVILLSTTDFNASLQGGSTAFFTIGIGSVTKQGQLIAGSNITLTPGAGTLTIAAAGTSANTSSDSVRVYNSTQPAIPSGASYALQFDSERWDYNSLHDTSSNKTRLTASNAGRYAIFGNVRISTPGGISPSLDLVCLYNGSTVIAQSKNLSYVAGTANSDAEIQLATIWDMAANDYVELLVRNNASVSVTVSTAPNHSPEFAMNIFGGGGSSSGSGSNIYPATATPNFPLGFSASTAAFSSTVNFSSNTIITATSTASAFKIIANGTYGTSDGTSGGLLVDCTGGGSASGECAQFYTNASTQVALGGIVNVIQALGNNTWNEPGIYTKMSSTNGGAANMRNDGPAPQIEWVETDQVSPAGKYEDGVNGDVRYIAGRKGDSSGFESFVELARPDASGGGYINFVSSRTPVRFSDGAGTHYVAFRASGTVASNSTYVWPATAGGANTVMQTDGSNNLFFSPVSSLTVTGVTAGNYTLASITVDASGRISSASNGSGVGVTGSTGSIGISIDGGGSAIVSGSTRSITVPYGCTISSWTVVADQSGSIVVHVSSSTYANYPTLSDMTIGGNPPKLTSQQKNAATPVSWAGTSLAQGSVVSFVVDSASTVTWVNIILWLVRT